MTQSKVNTHSATPEISCPSWNPKFHYSVHKSPLQVPVLHHVNLCHTLPPLLNDWYENAFTEVNNLQHEKFSKMRAYSVKRRRGNNSANNTSSLNWVRIVIRQIMHRSYDLQLKCVMLFMM
jgi:hypothetical protein